MKTLDEVKQDLEGLGKRELVEAVVSLIESEKQRGIEAHKKVNNEAANLRRFKKSMEAIGYSEDTDLDDFTASLVELKTKKSIDDDGVGRITNKALQEQIKSLTKLVETERNGKLEAEKIAKNKNLTAKLTQSLSDKVYGCDLLVRQLIEDNKVDLDGDNIVFKDNSEIVPYDVGLQKLLEQRSDIVKTVQKGGSGTTQSNTTPTNIDAIIKSNDKTAIRANLKEVAGALGLKL
jgi:hypothetical protein